MSDGDIKKSVSFRVSRELYDSVERYRESMNMSQSDAYRELVRAGIASKRQEEEIEQLRSDLNNRINELERDLRQEQDKGLLERLFN